MVACGILKEELRALAEKNGWPLQICFLASSLHSNLDRLSRALEAALAAGGESPGALVVYGCCHPRIDAIVRSAQGERIAGQNCIEMVLGPELFAAELAAGAFFLFEDWARHWERVREVTFGRSHAVMCEIFQLEHRYILALRTPCSGDFSSDAERMARDVGLPLRWRDVALGLLEQRLQALLATRAGAER